MNLGETSTTPLSPGSPADDSSGENHPSKSRLQRIKPQSRKTFRIRKSRKNSRVEPSTQATELPPVNMIQHQQHQPPPPQQISDQHRLRISIRGKPTESSWEEDSAISQTSSTSGYRESYPVMHLRENLESKDV
ncbi:hypothetical protein BDFB_002835 [Asbolus verrucosus]|uniref:Uncharacterized protein n=1 Tax=Asbolus verrucosus TaxID=1661398 RepID=A0A482WBD2_ASBVE|nr:hypothetical protein BDFB_002835 [Asbolus verrucosus]